jgi:acyl dehydratase
MAVSMTLAELEHATDIDLGVSEWLTVTQERINLFADATGDHQWIHVDPERAVDGPFGKTIAHGYLTLSLLPEMMPGLLEVPDSQMGVNYGIDRLRLTAPVPVDSRIRTRARLLRTEPKAGGLLLHIEATVEVEGSERPAMIGTVLYLRYGG